MNKRPAAGAAKSIVSMALHEALYLIGSAPATFMMSRGSGELIERLSPSTGRIHGCSRFAAYAPSVGIAYRGGAESGRDQHYLSSAFAQYVLCLPTAER